MKYSILLILIFLYVTTERVYSQTKTFRPESVTSQTAYHWDHNNFTMPFDQRGVLADVTISGNTSTPGGKFAGTTILYSSGFFLSGKLNDTVWSNGVLSASRISDYTALGGIFRTQASDIPFGFYWTEWSGAVQRGAKFYDGNKDGIYNPVDLNSNGVWDSNEDRPDLIGDVMYFCSFIDSVSPASRRFTNMKPLGIKIDQSIYGWSATNPAALGNTIFVRYRITSVNPQIPRLDSVYIGLAMDPDIGNFRDDLVGTDSLKKCVYGYGAQADAQYGATVPAIFLTMLQGPQYSKPGVTFTDVNNNGRFDKGIDIPLMNTIYRRGNYLGLDTLSGYSELNLTAGSQYVQSDSLVGDPSTADILRNYLIGGRSKAGVPFNACNWTWGNGSTLPNCETINTRFMYSGNPINPQSGWLNTTAADQRMIAGSGPFDLFYNTPIEVVYAITIARASDTPKNSVNLGKSYVDFLNAFYLNNFVNDIEAKAPEYSQNSLVVSQNFPNPFSQSTEIKYSVGKATPLKIVVYNILGQRVALLDDSYKAPGSYSLTFNAANLPAGIYFCVFGTESENKSIKMVVSD